MIMAPLNAYAFIDSTNLHLGVLDLGWSLDYARFRVYLEERYGVTKAYMFLGFDPNQKELYRSLQSAGYILEFKPILTLRDGRVKGNCDAELVLQAMIDYPDYAQAVIVTGDGDFHCLVKHLQTKGKLRRLIAPNASKCSSLLKKLIQKDIDFLDGKDKKLGYTHKRKGPHADGTA